MQESAADKIADRPLDGVVFLEVAGMGVKRLGDLRIVSCAGCSSSRNERATR